MAKVIEQRGLGFNYCVFEGTQEECEQWLNDNCYQHPNNPNILLSNDPDDCNGNGEPFYYGIANEDDADYDNY